MNKGKNIAATREGGCGTGNQGVILWRPESNKKRSHTNLGKQPLHWGRNLRRGEGPFYRVKLFGPVLAGGGATGSLLGNQHKEKKTGKKGAGTLQSRGLGRSFSGEQIVKVDTGGGKDVQRINIDRGGFEERKEPHKPDFG